jgi:circadian clock protein KaiC
VAKRQSSTAAGPRAHRKATEHENSATSSDVALEPLQKVPTGSKGLDEVSGGGLPQGRTTIVCGGPGCGKTMLGLELLVRGAQQFNEPGVLIAFEETPQEMAKNIASLGFDLYKRIR